MEKFCERAMKGDFPEDIDYDHKTELNAKFYTNVKKAGVSLRKLYKSAEDTLSRVQNFKKYFEWIPLSQSMKLDDYQKNDSISRHFRDIAKKNHKTNNLKLSLRAYNLALVYASDQREMYICHAERAVLLFQAEYYQDCLQDCKFYLHGEHKERNCLLLEIEELSKKCRKILEIRISKEDEFPEVKADIQKRLKYRENLLFKVKQPNPKAPSAETFISIGNDEVKGRQLLVTRDVPAGTVLAVEKPYVRVLMNGVKWEVSHCHHCFKRVKAGIPCPNCVFVFYCSLTCLKNALAYHQYECKCVAYMHMTRTPRYVQLAVRIVINAGFQNLYKNFTTKDEKYYGKTEKQIFGVDPVTGIYDSNSYLPIFHLVDHVNECKEVEQYTNIIQGIIFAHVLEKLCGFFVYPENWKDETDQDSINSFIASILVRHLQNVPCNSISMDEMDGLDDLSIWTQSSISPEVLAIQIKSIKYNQFGSAVYALSSLMNHSCAPNVARVHDMKYGKMALVALPSLSAGEELTTSYSRIFLADELEERSQYLESTYHFKCNCVACLKDWPVISLLNEAQPLLCCPVCTKKAGNYADFTQWGITRNGKCPMCAKQYQLEEVQKEFGRKMTQFFEAYDLVLANRPVEAIRLIAPVIQYFQFSVCPPFSKSHMAHDILKQAIDLIIFYSEHITTIGNVQQFISE